MCGIFCLIECTTNKTKPSFPTKSFEWTLCKNVIANRGPDSLNGLEESIAEQWHIQFYASVLWMQGSQPVSQPLVDSDSNIFLWNGDVFSGSLFEENLCDSNVVLTALQNSTDIYCTMKEIKGPFSFCYYQKSLKLLHFGRDRFGRHSLLFKTTENHDSLLLTSVAGKDVNNIVELPAIGIFTADFSNEKIKFGCSPWYEPNERFFKVLDDFSKRFNIHVDVAKVEYLPKLGELFINILTDCNAGFLRYAEIASETTSFDKVMDNLLKISNIRVTVNNLLSLLDESVKRRVKIIPKFCRNCTKLQSESINSCQHAKVGLLFSGGLDSAILAAIAHKHVDSNETIDLINVAFEKKNNCNFDVPDRKTGRQTYDELLKLHPERKYKFIEVDVSRKELEKYRSTQIFNLVYPLATVLDDSLACAVWFASKANGMICPETEPYESTCRVLLLGMGADEQFGGYMRHRTILRRNGWEALTTELKLEFDRISDRNLGRDDRMVADHGRQSRLPYLDEDFVDFVQKLPPWKRCCPTEKFPVGLGDKLLLRLLAHSIGLREASKLPKRAFQFGSRIADGKENAKDLSKRL
ncbi:asparagine synthetase domain-containing protein 1 [Copidosoma floridanum]|uniref:asparagine synthetase domain-containing protein 1 n=1 Tax=Copidosoma floridanum TaxID=29053 RepID=UPI0006C998E1|nr:asparagine synthetase domain-containing protein 1 [Copidosoma floridanum]